LKRGRIFGKGADNIAPIVCAQPVMQRQESPLCDNGMWRIQH
jgi:hypothetical protein